MCLCLPLSRFASYDDSGVSGLRSAFVCEPGEYGIYLGGDVRMAKRAASFTLDGPVLVEQCGQAMAPVMAFDRLRPDAEEKGGETDSVRVYEPVPLQTVPPRSRRERMLSALTAGKANPGDRGYRLKDVGEGNVSMEDFLSQISDHGLCAMMRGEGSGSPLVTPGIAGSFGGVTEELRAFGIPLAGCADGPSGIRMDSGATAFSLPNGTCLACSFNEDLNEELFAFEGLELRRNRIDALLGPGMNIHRNPLNGRNFEYFSEDPLLTGRMAAAQLRGLHRFGVTGVIKQFCGNTQETKRHFVNHVASERALREIYLKGFEIAVREGGAKAVMSTYGPVNGLWTSGNYDLLTVILREEWGFDGIVMTDWWAQANDAPGEPGSYKNVAAQVRAQNDLNMINVNADANSNKDNLEEALANGTLTRGELLRSASNICRFLLGCPCMAHSLGQESGLDLELKESFQEEDNVIRNMIHLQMKTNVFPIDPSCIAVGHGGTTMFCVTPLHRGSCELDLELRAATDNRVAQLPVSIFKDRELAGNILLNGADTDWQSFVIPLPASHGASFFLKLFFAQGGIEIRKAVIRKTSDLDDSFR